MGSIIGTIIYAIFTPLVLRFFFSELKKSKIAANNTMSDEKFIVMLPKIILLLGVGSIILFASIILVFIFLSNSSLNAPNNPGNIFIYIVFGVFICLGGYLTLKTAKFKVIVQDNEITVHSVLFRPYTFTFDEIVSVKRQVSKNKIKSESMLIKTKLGKKLNVESAEISYDRFLRRITAEVNSELLVGFEHEGGMPV